MYSIIISVCNVEILTYYIAQWTWNSQNIVTLLEVLNYSKRWQWKLRSLVLSNCEMALGLHFDCLKLYIRNVSGMQSCNLTAAAVSTKRLTGDGRSGPILSINQNVFFLESAHFQSLHQNVISCYFMSVTIWHLHLSDWSRITQIWTWKLMRLLDPRNVSTWSNCSVCCSSVNQFCLVFMTLCNVM